MAKATFSLPILPVMLLLFFFNSAGFLKTVNGQGKTWCVAKPSSSDAELAANIDFACNQVNVDCKIIQNGGPCYSPITALNHASVVMNLYYQFMGRNGWNCDFRGSGLITTTEPSYGSCHYA